MWDTEETICAIASPAGPAARGVIRISGPDCLRVICGLVGPDQAEAVRSLKLPTNLKGTIDLGQLLGGVDCRLMIWPTNRSYTGQPSAEIHMIGAAPLLQATLDRLHAEGARLARPGEFTLRAFLAGRLDLTQAEAVLGVIDADTRTGLGAALDQLTGGISQPLQELRESMIDLLADVEAGLDFVDEDIQFISDDQLTKRLEQSATMVQQAALRMKSSARSDDVPLVVLCGKPNAGKSSLLNCLAGFESAIVSNTVGTTRDPVEVRIQLGEIAVRIVDTAVIEKLADESGSIQQQAQSLSRAIVEDADLRIWCSSLEATLEPPPDEWAEQFSGNEQFFGNWLLVATKSDLVSDQVSRTAAEQTWLPLSSVGKVGVDALAERIAEHFSQADEGAGVASTAARCRETLIDAAAGLASAAEVVRAGGGHELVSAELRLAIDAIGRVTGAVYTEDILDSIFSRFCIGK